MVEAVVSYDDLAVAVTCPISACTHCSSITMASPDAISEYTGSISPFGCNGIVRLHLGIENTVLVSHKLSTTQAEVPSTRVCVKICDRINAHVVW